MKRAGHARSNTFIWLLILIVVMVSASVLTVGAVSYSMSARSLEEQTKRATLLRESQLLSRIDIEILFCHSITQALSENRSILDHLTQTSSKSVSDILRFREIMQSVSSLKMGNPGVSLISVYFQRSGVVLTDSTRYTASEFLERYAPEDRSAVLQGIASARPFTRMLHVQRDLYDVEPEREVLLLGKSLPYYSAYPFGAVLVEVPVERLARLLTPEPGGAQLVFSEQNELLLSAPGAEGISVDEVTALLSAQNLHPDDAFWLDASLQGQPYFAAVSVSHANKWRIVTLISPETIFQGISSIRLVTLGAGLLTALTAILISALLLQKLYTPIRRLLDVLEAQGIPYQSRRGGRNELAYIGRVIDVAWSENRRMREITAGMEDIVRQDVLNRLLDDIQVDEDTLERVGLSRMEGYFRVLLPKLKHQGGAQPDYDLCARALSEIAPEHPGAEDIIPLARPHNQVALLCYSSQPQPDDLPVLQAFCRVLPQALAASQALPGIQSLPRLFSQARETLYRAEIHGRKGVVRFGELPPPGRDQLLRALTRPEFTGPGALMELFSRAMASGDYPSAYLIDALAQRASTPESLQRAIDELTAAPAEARTLDALMRLAPDGNQSPTRKLPTKRLLAYLEAHHQNPNLSLTLMADVFGYTSSYISTLIKEDTGMGFLEYLTRLRIEKACELLSSSDLLVAAIADQTGFGHVNTFIRTFRKYKGVTPQQYRLAPHQAVPAHWRHAHGRGEQL